MKKDCLSCIVHFVNLDNSSGSAVGPIIMDHPLQLNTHTDKRIAKHSQFLQLQSRYHTHILTHTDSYNALCTRKWLFLMSLRKSVSSQEEVNEKKKGLLFQNSLYPIVEKMAFLLKDCNVLTD